jgi:hypothetical protein
MVRYENTALITCVDNNETVTAEVLDFKPQKILSISLQRSIKLILKYSPTSDEYQGEMYGRTFITKGPKGIHYTKGR